ncbi:MAG: AlpA family phage regulatory protein [Rhizobiaceae bacterium]|nr:AlpA family phage regulatory protein [Rhizobiaceae bacterium]
MRIQVLSIRQVVERTGLSRRSLYTRMSEGLFPKPIRLTTRRVGWPESDIDAWLERLVAERDDGVL